MYSATGTGKVTASAAASAFMPSSSIARSSLQRRRLDRAHRAGAVAGRARLGAQLLEARAQPLARQLEQTERADPPELHARSIRLELLAQPAFDDALIARLGHVDEIDHHQPGDVAQAELAGDLVGGLEIGLERGFLDVALARRAARVDVDRGERLGDMDHDRAARGQVDHRVVQGVEPLFHAVAMEQRHALPCTA